jgi:Bacteriocin-protection, YdeI or OmpD-Associated
VEVTEVFYPKNRAEWRAWLLEHHRTKTEIWVRTFVKAAAQPSLPYDHLVEEALCFGWIDGSVRKLDESGSVQRVTPRRKKTFLSELNRQRVWKLQRMGWMTEAGIEPIREQIGSPDDEQTVAPWVMERLQADAQVWANFQAFPLLYRRLKLGWVMECERLRRDESEKRLNYLIKMTAKNKQYGTQPLAE